jgi:hypothetical protein
MQPLQKIDIDWDIHKMIEAERSGFDEPPYIALRRLLRLPAPEQRCYPDKPDVVTDGGGLPWVEDGVTVPHGSFARMRYLRGAQVHNGRFLNGKLVVNGRSFDTLSAAAKALAVTRKGKTPNLNGWLYWEVQFPGENEWRSLNSMRQHK